MCVLVSLTDRVQLVLVGMQNRKFGSCLAGVGRRRAW
jgi:hypothetical protein